MRLDLASFLFAIALTGVSLFIGDPTWFGVAIVVLICWAIIPHLPIGSIGFWALFLALILLVFEFVVPGVTRARDYARRNLELFNLKSIATGLQNYRDTKRKLPPAVLRNNQGEALHSWRTLILPFGEEGILIHNIDLRQAWDSPANVELTSQPLDLFGRNEDGSQTLYTEFFAIVGPQTVWPENSTFSVANLSGSEDKTISVIQVKGRDVQWARPEDLTFDEAVDLLTSPISRTNGGRVMRGGTFYHDTAVRLVASLDGMVHVVRAPLTVAEAKGLLGTDEGEKRELNWSQIENRDTPAKLNILAVVAFSLFIGMVVLPVAWVRRRSARKNSCMNRQAQLLIQLRRRNHANSRTELEKLLGYSELSWLIGAHGTTAT